MCLKVLCNDPGYKNIGLSLLAFDPVDNNVTVIKAENITLLQTPNKHLGDLYDYFTGFIDGHVIDVYVYEKPYLKGWALSRNIGMLESIGILKAVVKQNNIKCIFEDYTPPHIKKVMTGDGTADKVKMTKAVTDYFDGASFPQNHACDALATGLTYLNEHFNLHIC